MFKATPEIINHPRYRIEITEARRAYHADVSLYDPKTGERLQQRRKVYDSDVNAVVDLLIARQDAKGDPKSPLTTAAQLRLLAARLSEQLDAAGVDQHGEVMHHLTKAAHDLHMGTSLISISQRYHAQGHGQSQRVLAEQHAARAAMGFADAMAACSQAENELSKWKDTGSA